MARVIPEADNVPHCPDRHHVPHESQWPVTIQPDGDPEHWFAPPDFRFVYSARYTVQSASDRAVSEVETYELRGRELVEAVERNPPELFRSGRRVPATE